MDAIDVRIFLEMAFKNPSLNSLRGRQISPSGIGQKLGLDEKTVRVRIKQMELDGFIKYYQAHPSLSLFGLTTTTTYRFEALNLPTKHRVVEGIREVPHIVEAYDYIGPHVTITIAGTSTRDTQATADTLANRYELSQQLLSHTTTEPTMQIPDKLDWQIMQQLRYNARRTTKELAETLNITPRMAEYRIQKLIQSHTLLVRAIIDPRKQQGLIFYELELTTTEPKQSSIAKQLEREHGEKLWSMQKSKKTMLLANLFGFTLGDPEEAAMNALQQDGVQACSLYILKEMIEPQGPNWIDNIIQQEIGNAGYR